MADRPAADVLAELAILEARVEAWDRGYRAGFNGGTAWSTNPYRAALRAALRATQGGQ